MYVNYFHMYVKYFRKKLNLKCLTGSEYASATLSALI